MTETLQDFLISVRYSVDAASQNNFLAMLKRVAGSTAGVALEIAGLTASVLKLTESLAETGERFYFMSQRLGSSVGDIQAATFALSNLGESSAQAEGNLERFGAWTRSMGPAATGWLRTMGVTATDTAGRMRQVAEYFRTHAAAPGSLEYAINLRKASMMGLDEQTLIAMQSGKFAQYDQRSGYLQQLVWGVGTPEQLTARQNNWASLSNKVMVQFREMGLIFATLGQQFGADLFEKMLPHLQALNQHLQDALPTISRLLSGAATAIGAFVGAVNTVIEVLPKLPPVVQDALIALTAWRPALALLRSPLAWLIGGLTTLLLLLDDYAGYQKGKRSLIDWGAVEKSPLFKIGKEFSDWYTCLSGTQKLMVDIAAGVALIATRALLLKGAGGLAGLILGGGGRLTKAGVTRLLTALGVEGAVGIAGVVAGGLAIGWAGEKGHEADMNRLGYDWDDEKQKWHKRGTNEWIDDAEGARRLHAAKPAGVIPGVTTPWSVPPAPGTVVPYVKPPEANTEQFGPPMFPAPNFGIIDGLRGIGQGLRNLGDSVLDWMKRPDTPLTDESGPLASLDGPRYAGPGVPSNLGPGTHAAGTAGDVAAMMRGVDQARGGGDAAAASASPADIGLNQNEWDSFRQRLGMRENSGRYGGMGGAGRAYAGKYQFGHAALVDTARLLGVPVPSQQEFLNNPEMQERFFQAYTLNHHRQLMRDPAYRALSPAQRAGFLAEAHLLGTGGALRELHGQYAGADAFNTSGHSYNLLGQQAVLGASRAAASASHPMSVSASAVINIAPGPDAHATASRVADAQTRVNENTVRTAQTALAR